MSNTTENKNNTIDDTYDEELYKALVLCGLVNKLLSKKMKVPDTFLMILKENKKKFKYDKNYTKTCPLINEKHKEHKKFKEETSELFDRIQSFYIDYKKAIKYISPDFKTPHKDNTTLINEDGKEVGEDLIAELKNLMMNKDKCPCWYYNAYRCKLELMDKDILHKNFKILQQDIKKEREKYDLSKQTYKIDKRDWYVIKVGGFGTYDVVLIKLFRDFFKGNAYFFCNEKNRDAMYEYLLK